MVVLVCSAHQVLWLLCAEYHHSLTVYLDTTHNDNNDLTLKRNIENMFKEAVEKYYDKTKDGRKRGKVVTNVNIKLNSIQREVVLRHSFQVLSEEDIVKKKEEMFRKDGNLGAKGSMRWFWSRKY